jgi:hypothetical protein
MLTCPWSTGHSSGTILFTAGSINGHRYNVQRLIGKHGADMQLPGSVEASTKRTGF